MLVSLSFPKQTEAVFGGCSIYKDINVILRTPINFYLFASVTNISYLCPERLGI